MTFFTFSKRAGKACSANQAVSPEGTTNIAHSGRSSLSSMLFITALLALTSVFASAQTRVTGKVVDANTKEPLIGATVLLKGTTTAASAGLDGSFKLSVPSADGAVLVVSYVSYITKEIPLSGKANVGEIDLKSSANAMNEVVITGDVAVDRKTPVAVSVIGPQFIEEKLGAQDIPQLLQGVPGVMVTSQGGGYGDSRVSIRGFSSRSGNGNVAQTINGIPVNDPETGAIFWSDYSGLTDVTTSLQVQRGLGASKIVVPSFGGTINVTTRNTDAEKGGYVYQTIGSNGYEKTAVLVSSGLNDRGWATTFQGSRTTGAFPFDGSQFTGYNYFFNLSKVLSKNQTISFSVMGASQTHGQRAERPISEYQNAPQGIQYNYYLSVENGKQVNPYNNFFSKPLFTINHTLQMNETSSLSTVFYATYGTGGGGGIGGTFPGRVANLYTPLDLDAVEKANATSTDGSAATYLYASHNDHAWYGLRSTYRTLVMKNIDLSAGLDLRYYDGTHYQQVTDLLSADYVYDPYGGSIATQSAAGNINNPQSRAVVGDKIDYYNKDIIETAGAFAQAEYSKDDFSAFLTLSGSESANKRIDYFNYLNSDPGQTSPSVNFFTYQAKAGANYNLNEHMNLFANIGYITKPPYFGTVFENFTNTINTGSVTEKLFSYELGYGFKTTGFSAKLNLYRSSYRDRSFPDSYTDFTTNQVYSVNISGVNELHQGAELELSFRPVKEITLRGMLSLGDWYYNSNAGPATVYDNQHNVVATLDQVDLKNMKLGDAAQTSASLGLDLNILPDLKLGADWYYAGNYHSYFNFEQISTPGLSSYQIPSYSIYNLNAVFKFKLAGLNAQLMGNVVNLLNSKYIADAYDAAATGDPSKATVYYGLGRYFTTGLKIKF